MSEITQIPAGYVLDCDDDGIEHDHEFLVDAGDRTGVLESLGVLAAALERAKTVLEAQR